MERRVLDTPTSPRKSTPTITVVQRVRDRLTDLIASRGLRPGDWLPPERDLMGEIGAGRSSLREALAILVALGVLTAEGRKGYRLAGLTPPAPALPPGLRASQVEELFEARRVLEVGIAELACLRATDADLDALDACLESILRARRARRSTAPSAARFHALLARASHNGLLETQLDGIRGLMFQVGLATELGHGSHFAEEQWEAHRVLLDTLRTRDPLAMRAAMLAHLERFAAEASQFGENAP